MNMKKKPFNTNYQQPFKKVHVPNLIKTDLKTFENENFINTLEEFQKIIPNPRITKDVICIPSSCPLTFLYIPSGNSVTCSKCGKEVRSMSPTF